MGGHELQPLVAAVHEGNASAVRPAKAVAEADDRIERRILAVGGRNEAARAAVARCERRFVGVRRRDEHRDAREAEGANQVHAAQQEDWHAIGGGQGHGGGGGLAHGGARRDGATLKTGGYLPLAPRLRIPGATRPFPAPRAGKSWLLSRS